MKRAIIIHGWESNPTEHWYQEERKLLEGMGYTVFVPEMPNTLHPVKEEWVKVITDLLPDGETVLIGHSLGVPAILRYLEKAECHVGRVVSIAGFAQDLGYEEINQFVLDGFDWQAIRQKAAGFIVINQKEDSYVPFEISENMAKNLAVESIKVVGNDHFDQMDLSLINRRLQ